MENLSKRIAVELSNIQEILERIPDHKQLVNVNELELAGTAALIHSFYNGIENIIKQILVARDIKIPIGVRWHKDLLDVAVKEKVINKTTYGDLKKYLTFRHFFTHAYAYDLDPQRLSPLVKHIKPAFKGFQRNIAPLSK